MKCSAVVFTSQRFNSLLIIYGNSSESEGFLSWLRNIRRLEQSQFWKFSLPKHVIIESCLQSGKSCLILEDQMDESQIWFLDAGCNLYHALGSTVGIEEQS